MKKNYFRKLSKSFIKLTFSGLAVFAVFGAALYAYAVTYPATQPNPVSGIVGLYVGKTAVHQGGDASGYAGANNYCNAAYTDSHVCTAMEIINTYNHNPGAITGETDSMWLNSGAPSYFSAVTNDCQGWTQSGNLYGNPVFGSVWNANSQQGVITTCSNARAYACCK